MKKTYNLLILLFLILCSCNNQSKKTSSKDNPYKDLLIYKETLIDDTVEGNEYGEEEDRYFYIIEKSFNFDCIRYIKGFICFNDSITYRYSTKYRVTTDTLFRCQSKEDDNGTPYLIKSDKECIFDDGFFLTKTQFQGEIINNGKKLFKYNLYSGDLLKHKVVLYCDSEFNTHKIESGERCRILLDTVPKSIVGIADSIQSLQFIFK